jgi:hypothetical protein
MRVEYNNGRFQLFADEGKIVTDGKDIYGTDITLAQGITAEGFYEISREEYERKLAEEQEAMI